MFNKKIFDKILKEKKKKRVPGLRNVEKKFRYIFGILAFCYAQKYIQFDFLIFIQFVRLMRSFFEKDYNPRQTPDIVK